jgi:hypothetical protein
LYPATAILRASSIRSFELRASSGHCERRASASGSTIGRQLTSLSVDCSRKLSYAVHLLDCSRSPDVSRRRRSL